MSTTLKAQHRLALTYDDRTRRNWINAACNEDARRSLSAWDRWPGGAIALVGPEGSGKSHLCAVWAEEASAQVLPAGADLGVVRSVFAAAEGRVVLDDADGGQDDAAMALLLDLARVERGAVLLAGRGPPNIWPAATPDLASRLASLPIAWLHEPDLDLLAQIIRRMARARFIEVKDPVAHYLAMHMERSFAAAQAVVDALDTLIVRGRRPVSHELARRALGAIATSREGDEGEVDENRATQ